MTADRWQLTHDIIIIKKKQLLNILWFGEQPYTEILFRQFSNIIMNVYIGGKILYQNLNVWLFSNPGEKVQKIWRTTGQICPVLSRQIWTLSAGLNNNNIFKCWFGTFPTIFTHTIMLENCQNNISVYCFSPIQGTKLYSCWNLMKPGSQSGTYVKKKTRIKV